MTRDDAMKRVLGAFATPSDGAQLANDTAFAQRLLAALAALDVVKLTEQEVSDADVPGGAGPG